MRQQKWRDEGRGGREGEMKEEGKREGEKFVGGNVRDKKMQEGSK